MADNTIEGQLDRIITLTHRIFSHFAQEDRDQKYVNGDVAVLAWETYKLALVVQMMASKQRIMTAETTF